MQHAIQSDLTYHLLSQVDAWLAEGSKEGHGAKLTKCGTELLDTRKVLFGPGGRCARHSLDLLEIGLVQLTVKGLATRIEAIVLAGIEELLLRWCVSILQLAV